MDLFKRLTNALRTIKEPKLLHGLIVAVDYINNIATHDALQESANMVLTQLNEESEDNGKVIEVIELITEVMCYHINRGTSWRVVGAI